MVSISTHVRKCHFNSATAGYQARFNHDVTCRVHCILKVPLDFVQDVFTSTSKEYGTGLGVLALGNEGEVSEG